MKPLITCAFLFLSSTADAHFYIDLTSMPEVKHPENPRGVPDGYELLSGPYYGLISVVGSGELPTVTTFGDNQPLGDAMQMILPENWSSFVDQQLQFSQLISWEAEDVPLLNVIAGIAKKHGLSFIVDFDQNLVQINQGRLPDSFNPNNITVMEDKQSGRQYFIYSEPTDQHGFIYIDGEYIPVIVN